MRRPADVYTSSSSSVSGKQSHIAVRFQLLILLMEFTRNDISITQTTEISVFQWRYWQHVLIQLLGCRKVWTLRKPECMTDCIFEHGIADFKFYRCLGHCDGTNTLPPQAQAVVVNIWAALWRHDVNFLLKTLQNIHLQSNFNKNFRFINLPQVLKSEVRMADSNCGHLNQLYGVDLE